MDKDSAETRLGFDWKSESQFFQHMLARYDVHNRPMRGSALRLPVDVREAVIPAGMPEGQLRVIDAHEMQDGGMEVVDGDGVLHGVVSVVVSGTVGEGRFDAAAGEPHREAVGIVVAAIAQPAFGAVLVFEHRGAAEFAAAHDQRVVEHPA